MKDLKKLFLNYPYKQYQNHLQKLDQEKLAAFFSDRFEKKLRKKQLSEGIISMNLMEKFSKQMGFDVFLLSDVLVYGEKETHYRRLLQEIKKDLLKIDSVLVAKEPIDNVLLNNALLKEGFYFVCGESVFTLDTTKLKSVESDGFNYVRRAQEKDIARIRKLSRNAHSDIRYYYDRYFDREKVGVFYEDIVSEAVFSKNERCFVYEKEGEIEGFITLIFNEGLSKKMGRGYSSLDYISVNPEKQKEGVGFVLNNYAIDYLIKNSAEICVVKTMASNYRAIRLLIKNHFVLSSQNLVYHYTKNRIFNQET